MIKIKLCSTIVFQAKHKLLPENIQIKVFTVMSNNKHLTRTRMSSDAEAFKPQRNLCVFL